MSKPLSAGFYITGGTVPRDAACYVGRQADVDLLEGLRQGQFCYVLTARQMGKSSLMVRTATKLRQEGVTCVVLDLTAIGQNLDAERWYGGLLNQLGQQVGMEDTLDDAWMRFSSLGPLQRWMHCLQTVVMANILRPSGDNVDTDAAARRSGRSHSIVIFIDEIDAVRNLPFSADEFFAAIRQCYNRRTENPEFNSLSFCLLGVATPADLIRDASTTPFNIGRRIELADFTLDEARVLSLGFGYQLEGERVFLPVPKSRALLRRVLYWTGGHPYLTQRLCKALGDSPAMAHANERLVDRLCSALFLDAGARERDDNLVFVRERLLRNAVDLAGLLVLYRKVREAKCLPADETDPLTDTLRLSGIARFANGRLTVRNRIYNRVFDDRWIQNNMPGAELRRQKAAYRRGVLRAVPASAAIILVMAGLTAYGLFERQARFQEVSKEQQKTEIANDEAQRLLYISDMNLIQQNWEVRPIRMARVLELLRETEKSKFRGIEWGIWYRRCYHDLHTFEVSKDGDVSVAFSPDGRSILAGGHDEVATLWNIRARRQMRGFRLASNITAVAFSPDGSRLITAGEDNCAEIWDARTGHLLITLNGHNGYVTSVAFSPNGRQILTGSWDNTARLWDAATGREIRSLKGHTGYVSSVGFSRDGARLLTGSVDTTAREWETATGRELRVITGNAGPVYSVAMSPDGRWVATGNRDNRAVLWPLGPGKPISLRHAGRVTSVCFSPDGRRILTGSLDTTAKLWEARTGKEVATLVGHQQPISSAAFSPDGKLLLTGSRDGTVKLWSRSALESDALAYFPPTNSQNNSKKGKSQPTALIPRAADMQTSGSVDGASPLGTTVRMWDAASGRQVYELRGHAGHITSVAFSPNGKLILSAGYAVAAELWNLASPRPGAAILRTFGGKNSVSSHTGPVSSIAFSPDNKHVLTGSVDKTARIWSVDTGEEKHVFKAHPGPVSSVAYSPDGTRILTGSRDGIARLWNAEAPRDRVITFPGHAGPISAVAFSPSGKFFVTGSEDATALLWDIENRRAIYTLAGQSGPISSVAYSRDGGRILTGSWDHTIWVWDAHSGKVIRKINGDLGSDIGPIFSVSFSPDGNLILAGGATKAAALWDAGTGQPLRRLDGAAAPVAFSPDGRLIATGSRSVPASGYDHSRFGTQGIEMLIVKANAGPISAVAFSQDGKHILTGSRDSTATLWDRANPGRKVFLKGHTAAVSSVAFSPDGTRLLTGSEDGTVKLWEADKGREILTLKANMGAITSVEFLPGGGSILARSADNGSMLWSAH